MSSPSSPQPPSPPTDAGPPPSGPPTGSPPPPPPNSSNTSSITSANYFFGFVITFVVLLLLFVGCGIGSWRRFRLIGTAWDERLVRDMDGVPFSTRKRGRRRLVRPVFLEAWTHPKALTYFAPDAASDKARWEGVQPISAALIWSRSKLLMCARKANAPPPQTTTTTTTTTAPQTPSERGSDSRGVVATVRSYVFPRRSRDDQSQKPPPVTRPPPEAIQVAVMIAMPSPPSTSRSLQDGPRYVGQSGVGEYQIGVVRIPWPSGEGP